MSTEINYLIDNTITNTIETYNDIKSPLIYTPNKKVKIKTTNWYVFVPEDIDPNLIRTGFNIPLEFRKNNLVENDNLIIRIDPITEFKYKRITNIKVNFTPIIRNNSAVPKVDNIKCIAFDKEYSVYFDEYLKDGQSQSFDCKLFGIDPNLIYNAIQQLEFYIDINFNGNRSNCNITIQNFNVEISFENILETEKKAIYSRLEGYFTDIDEYIDLYKDYLFSKTTNIIYNGGNTLELNRSNILHFNVSYNDSMGQTHPLQHQPIRWLINNRKYNDDWDNSSWIDLGYSETDSQGNTEIVYTPTELRDLVLVTIYEGNDNDIKNSGVEVDEEYLKYTSIKKARLDNNFSVVKYNPNVEVSPNKNVYNINKKLDNTYDYETINIHVNLDTNKDYPVNCKCELMNNNTVLRTQELVNVYGEIDFSFLSYNNGNVFPNKIRVTVNETDFITEKVITKNITININNAWSNKNYTAYLSSSNNYPEDPIYFKIVCNETGELIPDYEKVYITVDGIVHEALSVNGYCTFPLNHRVGVLNWSVRYDGKNDTVHGIKYNGFINNGQVEIFEWKWTTWHYMNHFSGGLLSNNNWTHDNSNNGVWKGWSVNGKVASCNNLGASGKDYRRPRHLKIDRLDTPFVGNIICTSYQIAFEDTTTSTVNHIEPSIKVNDGWVIIHMGNGYEYTGSGKKVTSGYTTHSVTRTGRWSLQDCNNMFFILNYQGNTGSATKKVTTTINGKKKTNTIELTYGGISVKNPRIRIFYRRMQNVW